MKPEAIRKFGLPKNYESTLEIELSRLGYSLSHPKKLADTVLKLSDYYTQNPMGQTPWTESWAKAASLAYYFPLNYARNFAVAQEAKRLNFFEGLDSLIDFGSGTASAIAAFLDTMPEAVTSEAFDLSKDALDLGFALQSRNYERRAQSLPKPKKNSLLLASYVVTELSEWPEWFFDAEALAIVEPSTQEDARKLMAMREPLMERGFHIWAPCTHAEACPLYVGSAKDWCHDRIHWDAPQWFLEMEKHLPMKNRTLTYSYLLARKTPGPVIKHKNYARLVGDMLVEKGKTRQALCRSSEREFLAWFPQRLKKGEEIELQRGNLIEIFADLEKKASEARVKAEKDLREILPQEQIR